MLFFPSSYGPDERIYAAQGQVVRKLGLRRGLGALAEDFLTEPEARLYPSALRWLWVSVSALVSSERGLVLVSFLSAIGLVFVIAATESPLGAVLVAASPLLLISARRALQDAPVSLLGLTLLLAHPHPVTLGVGVWALLSLKEAAVLWLPALVLSVFGTPSAILAIGVGVTAWVLSLAVIFGPRTAVRMLRAAGASHDHAYTRQFQSGGPGRYVADLAILSPVAVGAAIAGGLTEELLLAGALLATHCLVRVKNARFILGVDVLLRVAAAKALGPWVFAAVVWDLWTSWRLRKVYDPVTAVLVRETRMG